MYCPNCGVKNDQDASFCMSCGVALNAQTAPVYRPQEQVPVERAVPGYTPSSKQVYAYSRTESLTSKAQYALKESSSIFSVWSPFAGYGSRHNHQGWLMDNKGERAAELVEKVRTKFAERMIPDSATEERELIAKGFIVEKRPYFLIRRRLITVGLYIAKFGKDLYISIASYLKPPISNLKVLLVVFMLLFAMYTLFIMPGVMENKLGGILGSSFLGGRSASSSGLGALLCVIGPLGTLNILFLGLLLVYSTFKWLGEKDFLAALRVKPNEFNEDDLMAMEKAVEQTVRISMDEIGLDPDDLKQIDKGDERRLI